MAETRAALYHRVPFDRESYDRSVTTSPCFICQIVAGTHPHQHHIVYRDEFAIAFLNRYPTLVGYTLVAPMEHREDVLTDFNSEGYLRLQDVVHRVGTAIQAALPCERMYVLSLGSKQGNAHVHWHLAPLPPGVPYDEQQGRAISTERGYLEIPEADQAKLAEAIASALV